MAQSDPINGFVWGIVTRNDDPDGTGRVKVMVPGLIEPGTHYWVMPFGWPSGPDQQPRPPIIGEKVAVMFLYGEWRHPEAKAIYLRGYAGLASDGKSAGPTVNSTYGDAREINCMYEDDKFQIYVTRSGETAADTDYDRRLVLQTKRGTRISIDASAGENRKSEVIRIEGSTGVTIYSPGQVDIDGNVVTINGRKVAPGGGEI